MPIIINYVPVQENLELLIMCLFQVIHPIHDQTLFLNERHKQQLKEEFSKNLFYISPSQSCRVTFILLQHYLCFILYADVEPWTFEQYLGEAVFIPAGCPHQVRNRQVIDQLITSLSIS